ncbi:MAG: glycosyltransferase [Desulfobacteraceae bacterium]|nr:MAG: glycosyltransferase [Desulfobacteraceae bacterium]
MPFFSVCIPNYNYAHYIGETIQSVLDQTFHDFEIIVADNASTDNSIEVIQSFQDPRIKLIQNRYNIGFAPNLQRVSRDAMGEFLIMLSADDLMRPEALEEYRAAFQKQGEKAHNTVICSETDMIDADSNVIRVLRKPANHMFPTWFPLSKAEGNIPEKTELIQGKTILRESLRQCVAMASFCATAYPRALWEKVEGYDTTYHIFPDAAFLHKIFAFNPDYIWIHKRLFAYRVHNTNQDSQAARQAALKNQVDGYMRTVNYPQQVLDNLKLSRDDIIRAFLNVSCLDASLGQLARMNWIQSFKIMCFAFATYPVHTLKLLKTYIIFPLLLLGPLGCRISRFAKETFRK